MSRLLIIPAAGAGSRLGGALPKVLVPVGGVAMLDRLLTLYDQVVDRVVVVVNPTFADRVRRHLDRSDAAGRVDCLDQAAPTGMLDAILLARPFVIDQNLSSVWVTWCDQVAVHAKTIERLAARTSPHRNPLVMPTVIAREPYIHFERDTSGRIVRVLHRREGDVMPETGESDMGLFALSAPAFCERLPAYAERVESGHKTRERNFLPFIPWLARTDTIETFPAENLMEAVGINTPEELAAVEEYLSSLPASAKAAAGPPKRGEG
jgi:bifunctional N-acetylglucosamine-1-phosphate-uridyltransferase/glucosamine-1-phosphate-acetyltransferase GlmU-like protein